MKFSVVVPTFNRAATLRQTLAALEAQDYPDYEIIVVDDGSTDDTREIIAREFPRVRYVYQANRGPAAARNRGIVIATGDIIAFTDDDCVPPRDWLTRLADGYARYPQVAGVGGYLDPPEELVARNIFARYERFATTRSYRKGDQEYVGGLADYPAGGTNNMSYRKAILDQVGGFDEWFPYPAAEDHDLRVRVQRLGHLLLYLPLRVEHLHVYSFRNLVRQSIMRGRGVIRWEYKANGKKLTSRVRILLRFAKRALRLLYNLAVFDDKPLAFIHCLYECGDAYGQWLERRALAQRCT
jgi:glycosyltransferase involved in cell wall biosynthesis